MTWWQALLLGVLQGLTEYLPISSSGHLVLAQSLLGTRAFEGPAFEVFVHFGTLCSVAVYYRTDLVAMAAAGVRDGLAPRRWRASFASPGPFRRLVLVAVASVPAGLVGVFAKDAVDEVFDSQRIALVGLVATGCWLLATRLARRGEGSPGVVSAVVLGVAQAVAILPGVSRSGSTIGAGLLAGLEPVDLARFSFLMSFPVILGATVLQAADLLEARPDGGQLAALAVGTTAAFASGLVAIRLLVLVLVKDRLHWFGPYCLAVGVGGLWLLH